MTQPNLLDDPDFAPAGSPAAKEIRPAILAELAAGERLVWVGQPWRPPGVGVVPTSTRVSLGVLGGVGAVLGLAPIAAHVLDPVRNSAANLLFGGMVIAAGVALIGLSVWDLIRGRLPEPVRTPLPDPIRRHYEWAERHNFYALTDRRVILWEPVGTSQVRVRSVRAQALSGTSRTERPDGSGDLALEVVGPRSSEMSGPTTLGQLRRLEKVREAEALIRATLFGD